MQRLAEPRALTKVLLVDAFPMTQATALGSSFIIAARRTALGRPGGLHRSRRIESLTAPVVLAALEDAHLEARAVDEIIFGNTTAGGNPARIIGLAAGLRECVPALTVDRQCASGLDAILLAMRAVALGEADVVVAGGAESLSTAPWRVARPKSLFQTPRFMGLEPEDAGNGDTPHSVAASEELARRLGITRARQDSYALYSHLQGRAGDQRAPLRRRDRPPQDDRRGGARRERRRRPTSRTSPRWRRCCPPTARTPAATPACCTMPPPPWSSSRRRVHAELGAPRALRLVASSTQGVGAAEEALAPVTALKKLLQAANSGFTRDKLGLVEMSETSAAQALAVLRRLRSRR